MTRKGIILTSEQSLLNDSQANALRQRGSLACYQRKKKKERKKERKKKRKKKGKGGGGGGEWWASRNSSISQTLRSEYIVSLVGILFLFCSSKSVYWWMLWKEREKRKHIQWFPLYCCHFCCEVPIWAVSSSFRLSGGIAHTNCVMQRFHFGLVSDQFLALVTIKVWGVAWLENSVCLIDHTKVDS